MSLETWEREQLIDRLAQRIVDEFAPCHRYDVSYWDVRELVDEVVAETFQAIEANSRHEQRKATRPVTAALLE